MANTIKTNLGPVTAYADAKAHGYTGTREEFGALLANAGLNLKAAETAKEGAEAAKQAAKTAQQAAAENQKNTETQAANAKAAANTAAKQAAAAKESATGAANSASAAQESETNTGLSADAAANAGAAAKQAQQAAETAKTDAEAAQTAAGNSADAAAASAADAKKTLESIPDDYSTLSGKVDENANGIRKLKEDVKDLSKSVNGIELSKNLLDNSSVIANKRPSNWAGQTINDSYKTDGYHTFKAIPVTQNNTYYFVENGDLVNFGQLATYDKDGKYVSLLSPSAFNVNGVNVGYIIPENIAYVRGESKASDFSNVNFKLFNGRFEKKFLKYNESAYGKKILPVVVFDFDQVVEIDARFTILKKYGFVGNVVEVATNNYEITKKLIKMGYDISPYLGNHTWDYSTDEGIQNLTANIAEKLGGLEAVGVYNPTMISCSGHKYSDTMEKILSSYKIDYVRCSGFIKNGVSLKKSIYENSYGTRIVVPIGLGSYSGVDEFNGVLDTLVDGNVPLIMPFMHTFTYDADWITEDAFEKIVSHVSDLVKNGKALCMNMHDFVAYNDTVKSIHDDYVRNMSAIFN